MAPSSLLAPARAHRIALAACLIALSVTSPAQALDYVALGDSVASGYGLESATPPCYRARGAYPWLVLARLRERRSVERFSFLACSGAQASGASGDRSLARQVGKALVRIRERPTLVSLTIGINDLEWWNLEATRARLGGGRATFVAWLDASVGSIRSAVQRQLDRLLRDPRVSVVVTEYYDPFNRSSPLFLLCVDAAQCRSRTEEVVTALNRALGTLTRPRVRLARVQGRFVGHEGARPGCGLSPPTAGATWIQQDCLHPDSRGAAAIASAVDLAARTLGR